VKSSSAAKEVYPLRLRLLIAGVLLVAAPLVAGAVVRILLAPPGWRVTFGVGLFAVLALAADLKPVPLDDVGESAVSTAFVFVVACQFLFGWQYAVLVGALSVLVPQLIERKALLRSFFNSGTHALSAAASVLPGLLLNVGATTDFVRLTLAAFLGGGAFIVVNLLLVSSAVAFHAGMPLRATLRVDVPRTAPAFAVMACLAALAIALWRFEPPLMVLLAGPLFTLTLYQRSSRASRLALRDAHTDSLTGLGNHRAYEFLLEEEIAQALETGAEVSLCLIDVDDFKDVNDTFGHPIGDAILVELGRFFRNVEGEGFRLGGDEFALVLRCGETGAFRCIEQLQERIARATFAHHQAVTISAGVGSCPQHARGARELSRVADAALYWAKAHGKNRSCLYSPSIVRIYSPVELARRAEQQARLRAAENLVRVVDAKDTYTGVHSESVARLVQRLAGELGLGDELTEQLRLAGLLHDLGKIAISDRILQKPGRLDAEEIALLRTHPDLGASLLDGLELSPVDTWIRHHHEYWDGSGYPLGLVGAAIPFGSRIILVADAYHAIVSERSYRAASSPTAALAELRRMAGVQFDPDVVAALEACIADEDGEQLVAVGA
jgi:diguanylate cyclase (GGDEF)-like protein